MASKVFLLAALVAVVLLVASEATRDLAETSNTSEQSGNNKLEDAKYGGYPGGGGGGYPGGGGYQGGYPGGGGGYPGGGYQGGGGGYPGRGGYPGGGGYSGRRGYPGGGCRYGCCGYGYRHRCRCCVSAAEAAHSQPGAATKP